jgi:hypothetical protein
VLYSAYLNYRLPDGSLLFVRQTDCWCAKCHGFEVAEDIPNCIELETDLRRLANGDEDERLWIRYGTPTKELFDDLRRRIEWRRTRRSPPKCLHCGSTNIVVVPEGDEFAYPKNGERVVKIAIGFASTVQWHAEFTTEGELINSHYE